MNSIRRLSPPQSRKVNTLIKKECCNYSDGNCLRLDDGDGCVCPQLITYSLICKWFTNAVLPADKELCAEIYNSDDKRKCEVCGVTFISTSNRVKYCPDCRKKVERKQAKERKQKQRTMSRNRSDKSLV